jgi:hypothetical protein
LDSIFNMKFYAGIGARTTPESVQNAMTVIATMLYEKGYILRSGGAIGADQAFERGARDAAQIYLPTNDAPVWSMICTEHFHPNPNALTENGWRLMNRNALQILGRDGDTPVDFVICWTKDGKDSGGTGQAIRIARSLGIDVYNLFNDDEVELLATKIANLPVLT